MNSLDDNDKQPHFIPSWQRDMIDWLDGFKRTLGLRKIFATRMFTETETAHLKAQLALSLTPKGKPGNITRAPRRKLSTARSR